MENVLFHQLGAEATDNELLKFGELRIKSVNIRTNSSQKAVVYGSSDDKATIHGAGTFAVGGTEISLGSNCDITTTDANTFVSLPKYLLTGLNFKTQNGGQKFKFSLEDLAYAENMNWFTVQNNDIDGDISLLGTCSIDMERVYISGTYISGTVESLAEKLIERGRTSGELALIASSIVTLHGNTAVYTKYIAFSATGCVISNTSGGTPVATYTIGTGWSY